MVKFFCCRRCLVEIEPIKLADGTELADGTAALVCIDCDLIGLAHELAEGGPVWAAGTGRGPQRRSKSSN